MFTDVHPGETAGRVVHGCRGDEEVRPGHRGPEVAGRFVISGSHAGDDVRQDDWSAREDVEGVAQRSDVEGYGEFVLG